MSLDTVEIVLAVEDHFSLDIEDEEASKIVTVGDLRDLVVAKLEEGRSQRAPLHAATFHRLLRAISAWLIPASWRARCSISQGHRLLSLGAATR